MESTTEIPGVSETIVSTLPVLQRAISTLAEKECQLHGYDPTSVHCIVDAMLSRSIGIRIEPDAVPIVRISAVWAYESLLSGDSDPLVYGIRKAIRIAHTQFRWTLGKNKPRNAAEYVEKARRFRLASPDTFSLPVSSFRIRLVVEMSDPMTGEVLSREHVKPSELDTVQKEMAHELTARVYAHEQMAELLDLLHAHKDATEDDTVVGMDVKQISRSYSIVSLQYNTVTADV